jgi:hypothetical protein
MMVFVVFSEGRFINQSAVINLIEAETAVNNRIMIGNLSIEAKYNKFILHHNLLIYIIISNRILSRSSNKRTKTSCSCNGSMIILLIVRK